MTTTGSSAYPLLSEGFEGGARQKGANVGKEPYSEYFSWQVTACMKLDATPYDLAVWNGSLCSTCELFCTKDVSFVPFGFAMAEDASKRMDLRSALGYFARLGEEALEAFKSMLVFDALVFNEERHMGNYGVLRDAGSGRVTGMAPLLDNNLSMFASATPDEFQVEAMLTRAKTGRGAFAPSLDEQAALVIGPIQKRQLERLEGFSLVRHPVMDLFDETNVRNHMSEARMSALNEYLARRVEGLLALPTVDPEKVLRDVLQ